MGDVLELEVGPPAHGGHWVARYTPPGADRELVVFVRHALTGERVRARVTQANRKYLRADAVEVLTASPDRVTAPCPYAGRCGGCDYQHVDVDAQRRIKAEVVTDVLRRIGHLEVDGLACEAVPDPDPERPGQAWRTRMRYAVAGSRIGMYAHRSHLLVDLDACLLESSGSPRVLGRRWPDSTSVSTVVDAAGNQAVWTTGPDHDEAPAATTELTETVQDETFRLDASSFWQVHPAAARTLVDAVRSALQVAEGEVALDLYAGVGLFARFLGLDGATVLAVESDEDAVAYAEVNTADLDRVRCEAGDVADVLAAAAAEGLERADVVVLDPPRTGAGPDVVARIAALHPRRVAYVACDPAALARDLASFAELGYELADLRAFDLFPMTHHVECVVVLDPASSG